MNVTARAHTQQVCSLLLQYPEEALVDLASEIGEVVTALPNETSVPLGDFLDYLATTPLIDVQRHFVATFDMRRKCSPYLTYWTYGDTRNRGMALLHFKEAYREAGITIDEQELPDHLAVVLEFAACHDVELGNALLAEHRGVIALLHQALVDAETPYANVLEAVLATTSALTPEDELLMKQLALTGPPTESVGMAGPIDLTLAPFGVQSSDTAMGARR
jgi:nitrate reductase delta subunit